MSRRELALGSSNTLGEVKPFPPDLSFVDDLGFDEELLVLLGNVRGSFTSSSVYVAVSVDGAVKFQLRTVHRSALVERECG